MSLGNRLKEARKQKNLTQNNAAKQLGITFQALSNYERDARDPDTTLLKKMAELYDVTTDQLLTDYHTASRVAESLDRYGEAEATPPSGGTPVTNEVLSAELKKIREELKQALKTVCDSTGQQTSLAHEEGWTEDELQKIEEYKSFIRKQRPEKENANLHYMIHKSTTLGKPTPPDTKPTKRPR